MAMSRTDECSTQERKVSVTRPAADDPGTQARRRKARRTAAVIGVIAVAIFVLSIVQMLR